MMELMSRAEGEAERDAGGNAVFMGDHFPPQKAVIGINYLTGANREESHN